MSYRSDLSKIFNNTEKVEKNKLSKKILKLSKKHNLKIHISDLNFILRRFKKLNNNNDAIYSIIESTNS